MKRKIRADSVRTIVTALEPAQICLNLRQLRITLKKRYEEISRLPVCPETNQMLCAVIGRYHETVDRLLRLSRVPQAPSGASAKPDPERPQLDITPEALPIDTPEDANPGGSPESDSPI